MGTIAADGGDFVAALNSQSGQGSIDPSMRLFIEIGLCLQRDRFASVDSLMSLS